MSLTQPPVTIWSAAKEGRLDEVQRFVEQGTGVDSRGPGEFTALHKAACAGHLEIVRWLIDNGANPNARTLRRSGDAGAFTPLHLAVQSGHIEVARLLIDRGTRINTKMSDGSSALMLAAESGRLDMVTLLLDHGADLTLHSRWRDPAFSSAVFCKHWPVAELLLQRRADINERCGGDHCTPLMVIACNKEVEGVRFLIAHGADVHIQDDREQTALHNAVIGAAAQVRKWGKDENGKKYFEEDDPEDGVRVIHLLLSAGAATDVADAEGFTPVTLARKLRLTRVVELLEHKEV